MPRLPKIAKYLLILPAWILFAGISSSAPDNQPERKSVIFKGTVNSEGINIRADSTVRSPVISNLKKGTTVEVVYQLYDWYKIRLPKDSPAYINKRLVEAIGDESGRVTGKNVNIRLEPNDSSRILGRADTNEVITILEEKGGWYKIAPTDSCFGWVHKKFIDKISVPEGVAAKGTSVSRPAIKESAKEKAELLKKKEEKRGEAIVIEGIVMPYGKVLSRQATHKLATEEEVFLLKGNRQTLDSLNRRKVRVTGKLIPERNKKYRTIEITKIELTDRP